MDTLDLLDLDSQLPKEVIVKYGGRKYLLREASGDAVAKYRNVCARAARMDDGKLVGMEGLFDAEPYLVSLCLYYADAEGKVPRDKHGVPLPDKLVAVGTVRSWPNRTQRQLYDWLDTNSDLGKIETKESLQRQQQRITEQLAKLEATAGTDPTKAPPAAIETGFDSPPPSE